MERLLVPGILALGAVYGYHLSFWYELPLYVILFWAWREAESKSGLEGIFEGLVAIAFGLMVVGTIIGNGIKYYNSDETTYTKEIKKEIEVIKEEHKGSFLDKMMTWKPFEKEN